MPNTINAWPAVSRSAGKRCGSTHVTSSLAIVTMTLARSAPETALLQTSLRTLTRLGCPVVVGDGGSDESFLQRIGRLPNLILCHRRGRGKSTLVGQLQTAFAEAERLGPGHVLYTEPDKLSFFRRGARTLLEIGRRREDAWAGLILASRSPRRFSTYPPGQRVAESFMNRLSGEALGHAGDYTYGPMLISRALLPHLGRIPTQLGWGWRFFLMGVAHQLRAPIELLPVGSQCPRAQRGEDDARAREYRLRQLIQNVTGLANGWTSLLDAELDRVAQLMAAA